jgi:hypothetical protein
MQESNHNIASFLGSTAVKQVHYWSDQRERFSDWFFCPSAHSQRNKTIYILNLPQVSNKPLKRMGVLLQLYGSGWVDGWTDGQADGQTGR